MARTRTRVPADDDGPASPRSPRAPSRGRAAAAAAAAADADGPASPTPARRSSSKGRAASGGASTSAAVASAAATAAPRGWPGQHQLRVDSDLAWAALLYAPLLVWWLCVFSGVAHYDGPAPGKHGGGHAHARRGIAHPMLAFDRAVLRPAGGLLPFAILALRVAVNWAADRWDEAAAEASGRRASAAGDSGSGSGRKRRLATLAWSCGWLYALVALARILLYVAHLFALKVGG